VLLKYSRFIFINVDKFIYFRSIVLNYMKNKMKYLLAISLLLSAITLQSCGSKRGCGCPKFSISNVILP